jgi:indolepyruvate ferredoxin oxidoreductase, beta subunit
VSGVDGSLKKILILALGGEGGGTLTEWVVEAGLASHWPIQATSIPGVAQRTGATSYYIECLPMVLAAGAKAPPMCLAPLAGDLDLIISSELLESARAVERGLADRSRTMVISSTARALTIDERTSMSEGRLGAQSLEETLQACAARLGLFDMTALAKREGTIVSAVMFGALVGSGVLPFTKEICEAVIVGAEGTASAPRAKASLRGFSAGFAVVQELLMASTGASVRHSAAALASPSAPPKKAVLESVEQVAALGVARLQDFQDEAYARQYQDSVARISKEDSAPFTTTIEAARHLALWMAYEDVIRVADLKSRRSRFEQIRADYQAKPTEPVIVRDFLKPGVEEIAAILPTSLAVPLLAWAKRSNRQTFGEGMQLSTSSITGLLAMRALANLRFLRRRSSRFLAEQALIKRWEQALLQALQLSKSEGDFSGARVARAIAAMPRLIKGYSDTFSRGRGNFVRILESVLEPSLAAIALDRQATKRLELTQAQQGLMRQLAESLEAAQKAALANPDGSELYRALGLDAPPVKEQVIKFARPISRSR